MSDKPEEAPPDRRVDIEILTHPKDDYIMLQFTVDSESEKDTNVLQLPMTSGQALEFVRNVGMAAMFVRTRALQDGAVSELVSPEQRSKMN